MYVHIIIYYVIPCVVHREELSILLLHCLLFSNFFYVLLLEHKQKKWWKVGNQHHSIFFSGEEKMKILQKQHYNWTLIFKPNLVWAKLVQVYFLKEKYSTRVKCTNIRSEVVSYSHLKSETLIWVTLYFRTLICHWGLWRYQSIDLLSGTILDVGLLAM